MPLGSIIHNIEEQPGKGGQYIRAGGGYGQILDKVSFEESKGNLLNATGGTFGKDTSPLTENSSSRKKVISRGHPFLGGKVLVRLPSGEKKWFPSNGRASFGAVSLRNVSNEDGGLLSRDAQTQASSLPQVPTAKKKAGRSRWLGRRPKVRGIAMNPVDHPHGGRTSGGRPSVTPWGRPTKGWKTRSPSKTSFQYKGRI
jgi:large subunit ribosomal protein L2